MSMLYIVIPRIKIYRNQIIEILWGIICKNCGYLNDKIITDLETCSETILELDNSKVIFFFYELGDENDDFDNVLNKIRKNISLIKTQIKNSIIFKNELYLLASIICCPYNGHYISIIVNLRENMAGLKTNTNYFYDDCSLNHELREIGNYEDLLDDYLPYVVIYIKNN